MHRMRRLQKTRYIMKKKLVEEGTQKKIVRERK